MRRVLLATVAVFVLWVAASPAAGEHTLPNSCALSPTATTYEGPRDRSLYLKGEELASYNMIAPGDSYFRTPVVEKGPRSNRSAGDEAYVPPRLLKAIGHIESNTAQADHSVYWGATGPTKVSFDCGYGIMQITSGMTSPADGGSPSTEQSLVATHYLFNIARGAAILVEKWNAAPQVRPIVGNGDPRIVEDWYFAVWSYNGFAGVNNPLSYGPHSGFSCGPANDGFGHNRGNYPYQELVFGCATRPPSVDGQQLWSPLAVTLPNLDDPLWRHPLTHFPDSSQMDMPTPGPAHQDSTPQPGNNVPNQLLGSPSLGVGPTSVSQVVNQVTISNSGSGILAWRAKPEQAWISVNKKAGVALGSDVSCTPGNPCDRSVTLTITVNTALAPTSGQGQVTIESLTTGESRTVWVIRDYRADGSLLSGSGPEVYLMKGGLKHHIPNGQTFEAQGFDWGAVLTLPNSTVGGLPTGQPLLDALANGNLLAGSGDDVYVMESGVRRHVASPTVLESCGYSFGMVAVISDFRLGRVPTGGQLTGPPCPAFSPPTGSLLGGSGSAVYVMSVGLRRHVPNGVTFEAQGYEWGNVNEIRDALLASIPSGAQVLNALANGNLLTGSGDEVYVISGGVKRHVASRSVMTSCGYSFNAVSLISDLRLGWIPTGGQLTGPPCPAFSPPTGSMLSGSGPAVYVMSVGLKRHVPNGVTFEAQGYLWGDVSEIPDPLLASIPSGVQLLNALANGNLLAGSGPEVYVMSGGVKRHVTSPSVMGSCGYSIDAVSVISDFRLGGIPTGGQLTGPPCPAFSPATGTLLAGSGSAVYVMSVGLKRHIASAQVFAACGYLWGNVNHILDSTLNSIPTGSTLTGTPCP